MNFNFKNLIRPNDFTIVSCIIKCPFIKAYYPNGRNEIKIDKNKSARIKYTDIIIP